MYVTRIQSMVVPGKIREAEAFAAQAFDMVKSQPGFLRGGVVNSLGYPAKYTSLAAWETREAAETFRRSDAYQRFLLANPLSNVATPLGPAEAFESVYRVQDRPITEAGCIALVDITIDPTKAPAFEQRSQELLDLRAKVGHGLISSTLTRFMSGGGRYLGYSVYTDQEAAQRTQSAPEVQAFMAAHPLAEVGGTLVNLDIGIVVVLAVPALVS